MSYVYILYCYNKVSQEKENIIKEIIKEDKLLRKRKYIYSTVHVYWKKICM